MKKLLTFFAILSFLRTLHAQEATLPATSIKEYPVLFQQTAAEYRALCYQAFNLAQLRIDAIPRRKLRRQKLAIITDLDETILDNSYQEAQQIKEGKEYSPQSWKNWTNQSAATAVPGAVAFLQAAKQKGIHIFYISNRDTTEINSTLLNLQKLQLPDADTAHMLFLLNTSSKEVRRQKVMQDYEVVMLMGDNLTDFTTAFEKKPIDERKQETDKVKEEWGKKFIVLPNAIYGEWENALYDYDRKLTPVQKEEKRLQKLKGY
jgi:5'-nucleotidase (lipoprotein e(P4) family)